MVFPFILLYGADELAALETAMTVLMWWGHSFHATFPHPPVHITGKLSTFLSCMEAPAGHIRESRIVWHIPKS